MHRHVRRVGDEPAVAIEHRTGEVEPFLDVDRIGGVLQRDPHLLGDRHEEMIEDLEHDRVGLGADRLAPGHGLDARHHHMVFCCDLGTPALFDDDCLMWLDDRAPAHRRRADRKRLTQEDIRLFRQPPCEKKSRRPGGNGRRS